MPYFAKMSVILAAIAAALSNTPATAQSMSRGVLISSTPIAGAPIGASAFRIRYHSRAVGGERNQVTGVVIVPKGAAPRGGRDVVAWAHGTSGVAESCIPSQSKALFESIAGLNQLLAAGYAVVATDYAGLGTPGPHPYLVGDGSAYSVLDSVRAAREFGRGSIGNRFVVWGESQGGHAALWTGQFARRYAPELQLAGIAAAAPPTDLKENLTGSTNPLIKALLTAYTGTSWSQTYDIPLSTILKPVGQDLAKRLARNCVSTDPVALKTKIGLFRFSRSLAKVDISTSPPWAEQLRRNSVQPAGFSVPVLIAQGSADPIVAPGVTLNFAQSLCRSRSFPVRYLAIEGGDHFSIGKRSADVTVRWIADRFAGQSAPDDCGRL
jgi:pimeloyl-ACP methyl ester carboxylesterase